MGWYLPGGVVYFHAMKNLPLPISTHQTFIQETGQSSLGLLATKLPGFFEGNLQLKWYKLGMFELCRYGTLRIVLRNQCCL